MLVRARFADGGVRDVTADARYSSSNENAATVAQIRAATAARKTPWTAAELAQIIPVKK